MRKMDDIVRAVAAYRDAETSLSAKRDEARLMIGDACVELRKELGLTVAQLGALFGVIGRSHIFKIERPQSCKLRLSVETGMNHLERLEALKRSIESGETVLPAWMTRNRRSIK